MKKSYLLVSAVMAMCLCACQNAGPNSGKSVEPSFQPVVTPTMEVGFKAIENDCMVPEHVQKYVDAMHEQEAYITYPHRVDRLNCNMDWETAANQSDKGDGVI